MAFFFGLAVGIAATFAAGVLLGIIGWVDSALRTLTRTKDRG